MTEKVTDRPSSISSSVTEAENFDDNEKNGMISSSEGSYVKLKSPEEMDIGDVESAELLPQEDKSKPPSTPDNSTRTAVIWMVVNTLATIGIVGLLSLHLRDRLN
jgi:solute carrier family 35 protein E3